MPWLKARKQMVFLNPGDLGVIWYHLGALSRRSSQFRRGRQHLSVSSDEVSGRLALRFGMGLLSTRFSLGRGGARQTQLAASAEKSIEKLSTTKSSYLSCHRVHLSEILLDEGRLEDAEALLSPVASSGDPEVNWRLADVMVAREDLSNAELQMQAARSGFEKLLEKYPLAFADHGAEFYAGSGSDSRRAFKLARTNLQNRPTTARAEQVHEAAMGCGPIRCS